MHHILHIDERDVLTAETDSEVAMRLDALGHEEIVFLTRTIDSSGAENDIGKTVLSMRTGSFRLIVFTLVEAFQKLLGQQFALPVGRIGPGRVALTNLLVRLLLTNSSEDAERTEIDKTPDGHLKGDERPYQILRSLGVSTEKVLFVKTFRHACGMHDIVEGMARELFLQPLLRPEIQFDEVDTTVLQPLARAARPDGSPHFQSSS